MKQKANAAEKNLGLEPQTLRTKLYSLYIEYLSTMEMVNNDNDHMGRDARKPVFGVSYKMIFKPACSATETS